jgi:hypothetical protein
MDILTQRDHVDREMPRRGRARIAGSATAARFGRFSDSPASVDVPATMVWDILSPDFAAIDIGARPSS